MKRWACGQGTEKCLQNYLNLSRDLGKQMLLVHKQCADKIFLLCKVCDFSRLLYFQSSFLFLSFGHS